MISHNNHFGGAVIFWTGYVPLNRVPFSVIFLLKRVQNIQIIAFLQDFTPEFTVFPLFSY